MVGKNAQKAANPTQAVEPVIWSSTYGTVTSCIQVPVFESTAPTQNSRKSR